MDSAGEGYQSSAGGTAAPTAAASSADPAAVPPPSSSLRRRVSAARESLVRKTSVVPRLAAGRSIAAPPAGVQHRVSLAPRRTIGYRVSQLGGGAEAAGGYSDGDGPGGGGGGGGGGGHAKTISVMHLAVLGFFWTSGGIYGNEELLAAAPVAHILALCVAAPLLYALPLAAMTAELSAALPVDGARVVFVQEAFGDGLGLHNGVWCWLVSVVDAAVYPAMAAEYIDVAAGGALGRVPGGRLVTAQAIVALLTVANLGGMEWILRLELAFAVVTVVPCLLYIGLGFGLGKADFGLVLGAAAAGAQPVDWAKLLSWVMWLYSGFDSFGSVAGEIEEPQRTIPLAVALLLPVVTAFNTLPFVVAATLHHPDRSVFVAGYFSTSAAELAGPWLGSLVTAGGIVMLFGTYDAVIISAERVMLVFFEGGRGAGGGGNGLKAARSVRKSRFVRAFFGCCPALAAWLAAPTADGVRRLYVVFNAGVVLCLVAVPYPTLVSLEMYVSGLATVAFAASFVQLRRTQPELDRPYVAVGGGGGPGPGGQGLGRAVALAALPVSVVLVYYVVGARQAYAGEAESIVGVAGLAGALLLGALAQCVLGTCFKAPAPLDGGGAGDSDSAAGAGQEEGGEGAKQAQVEQQQADEERRGLLQ